MLYDWRGNIRELEKLIERGVIFIGANQSISADALFPHLSPGDRHISKLMDRPRKTPEPFSSKDPRFSGQRPRSGRRHSL